jgi:hypothetical protein
MASRHCETSFHWIHQSLFLRRLEGRLWDLLEALLKQLRPSHSFYAMMEKLIRLAFRFFEISLNRLLENRFLLRSEGRLWIHRANRLLKSCLKQLRRSRFFLDVQEAQNEFVWPFDSRKYCYIDFTKVVFKTSRSQIMRSHGHSPT